MGKTILTIKILTVFALGLASLLMAPAALSAEGVDQCLGKVDRSLQFKLARAHEDYQGAILNRNKFLKRIFAIEDWHETAKGECVAKTTFHGCDTQTIISCSYSSSKDLDCEVSVNEASHTDGLQACKRDLVKRSFKKKKKRRKAGKPAVVAQR